MILKNRRHIFLFLFCILSVLVNAQAQSAFRAPAYPLVTIDPYTSAWSFSDKLYDDAVRHWTGKPHGLLGAIRVDGTVYRFMGKAEQPMKTIIATAAAGAWKAKYTFEQPQGEWTAEAYSDAAWTTGDAAFGTRDMPFIRTPWETKDIWVRREITLTQEDLAQPLILEYSHDDNFELYINGVKMVDTGYDWKMNVRLPLTEAVVKTLHAGKNIIAAHCFNKQGGAYVDFGLLQTIPGVDHFGKTATQRSVQITPTQTQYQFDCGPVTLSLNFTSPLLANDLALLSRPVSYVAYGAVAKDGKPHNVEVYFEVSSQWAVHDPAQAVTTEKSAAGSLTLLKAGTVDQKVLERKGDDVRIDWGYVYLAGSTSPATSFAAGDAALQKEFATNGKLDGAAASAQPNTLGYTHNLGKVSAKPVSGRVMIGYDDLYAVQYFGKNLQAWWKENGKHDIVWAFLQADTDYAQVLTRCNAFDKQLSEAALKAGGKDYQTLCALAYRQAIAAHKLVRGENDEILFFSKENFSNGSIGTVDVTYPSAPLFLQYNPDLLKGMMNPIFYYSESGKWTKPFPAHDVGTYPLANGQTYGEDMPVEESGNMMILAAAIATVEGNADYAKKHWQALTTWVAYLEKDGFDPGNQLCTDDFAGHIARNANLSIKSIMALASYGKLAGMLGDAPTEKKYMDMARGMATKWMTLADDGDHYTLTFENKGTWSQKYNLVWDRMLGFNVFPESVAAKEISYYLKHQNTYGLPLDSRKTYTKSDWIIWTATMAKSPVDFKNLVTPVYTFADKTTDRGPLSDWHETTDGKVVGFRARSVVGGYYIKILADRLESKPKGKKP